MGLVWSVWNWMNGYNGGASNFGRRFQDMTVDGGKEDRSWHWNTSRRMDRDRSDQTRPDHPALARPARNKQDISNITVPSRLLR